MRAPLLFALLVVCLLATLSVGVSAWWDSDWSESKCLDFQYGSRVNEPIRVNLSSICEEGVNCLSGFDDIRVIQQNTSLTYQLVDMYYNTSTPFYWLYFIAPNTDNEVCLYWNNPNATPINNASLFYFIDEMDGLGYFGYDPNPAYYEAWAGYMRMNYTTSYLQPPNASLGWCRVGTPDTISSYHCRNDVMTKEYFTAPFYVGFEMFNIGHDGSGCPNTPSCGEAILDWGTNIEYDCYNKIHGLQWAYSNGNVTISLWGNSTGATLVPSIYNQPNWRAKFLVNTTTIGWVWNGSTLLGTTSVSDGLRGSPRQLQLAPRNDMAMFDLNYLYVSPENFTTYSTQNTLLCNPDWNCSGYADCLPNNTQPCNTTIDLNGCGEQYGGNYSEFEPQVCDFCSPDWSCSDYGECQPDDNQYCIVVTDNNSCAENYTGNYSEFETLPCDFCIPDWNCTHYTSECEEGFFLCNETADLNQCGEAYDGNYSEFQDEPCEEQQITGYVAQYGVGDIPLLTIDTIGKVAVETMSWLWLIILIVLVILTYKYIKRVKPL